MGHAWHMKTPVKTGPEFQPGIVWNSGCTPGEFRRNYCRHSAGILAVFQTIPPGVPADLPPAFPEIPPELLPASPGIPPELRAGIRPELLPHSLVLYRNSGLELLPAFP